MATTDNKNIYSRETIADVSAKALIADHLPPLSMSGRRQYLKCPQCGAFGKVKGKLKGLIVTDKTTMHIAKCFDCGFSLSSAIYAEMYYSGADFRTALERCADKAGMSIETERDRELRLSRERAKRDAGSFVAEQLAASGLTFDDVMVRTVGQKGKEELVPAFRRGSIDHVGNINPNDDEMLIYYYDLKGEPVRYAASTRGNPTRQYVRVRWAIPGLHTTQDGKEIKYQTPRGAQTQFYIPQKIRDAYADNTPIGTLIIQEGEKKAEKACKHGIMSIGIQGIYNIGNARQGVMKELSYLVKACKVRNVVLLFDSDWCDLSRSLECGDRVDSRPMQFAKAAIKFRDYVKTLHNEGLHVDVWFGHINSEKEKGIDDLLCGSLAGREHDFATDMERTMLTHDGRGEWADYHRISTLTNFQIMDYWHLNKLDAFVSRHSSRLESLEEIRFGGVLYSRTKSGHYTPKSEDGTTLKFWNVEYNDRNKKDITFDSIAMMKFLSANNYRRVHTEDMAVGEYVPAVLDGQILHKTAFTLIKNFLFDYLCKTCKDESVLNKFLSNMGRYVTPDIVNQLPLIEYEDYNSQSSRQIYPYSNGFVEISAEGISDNVVGHVVWEESVIPRTFRRVPIFERMEWRDGYYDFKESKDASECEFLQFLKLSSNFWHRDGRTPDLNQWYRHLYNKMSCIGYLLHSFKDMSETKAIVAMDGRMSEVGKSNGRSGKSLVAAALRRMIPQSVIDGRNLSATDDFVYNDVNLQTRTVVYDDVNVNFNFGRLFAVLTNDMTVNYKGGRRFTIPFERSPKIMITTNHALSSDDDSSRARRVFMAFSDYFNANHSPKNEFGHNFFQDWDERQWTLFDNFMLECLQMYLKCRHEEWEWSSSGLIEPPMEELTARQMRQVMGEDFLDYAEQYYGGMIVNKTINTRLKRRDVQEKFKDIPGYRKYFTPSNFRTRLEAFVRFKKWHFNPHKRHRDTGESFEEWIKTHPGGSFFGEADKSNSIEYFTVSWNGALDNTGVGVPPAFEEAELPF
ncbi:MAG: DUF3854 domain-containing protein [Muribaculaceae bacterium]|nr:DUF3854 domain-containing protein [Muribaculaceae bacterium]